MIEDLYLVRNMLLAVAAGYLLGAGHAEHLAQIPFQLGGQCAGFDGDGRLKWSL